MAEVGVGSDRHQFYAGEASGVHDLAVKRVLGFVQQALGEEKAHRHIAHILGLYLEVAVGVVVGVPLPVVRVNDLVGTLFAVTTRHDWQLVLCLRGLLCQRLGDRRRNHVRLELCFGFLGHWFAFLFCVIAFSVL